MTSQHLENLVKIGKLKAETSSRAEFDQLLASAKNRLEDAKYPALSTESRFALAGDPSHSAALAALQAAAPLPPIQAGSPPNSSGMIVHWLNNRRIP